MDDKDQCTIRAHLIGAINARLGVLDRVSAAEVYVLAAREQGPPLTHGGAAATMTAQAVEQRVERVTEQDVQKALDRAGSSMTARTGDDGSCCLLGERFDADVVDVYVALASVPLGDPKQRDLPLPERVYLHLGLHEVEHVREQATLRLVIPQRTWCPLKRAAGSWTVVGQITACGSKNVAVGGVTVAAFDKDITADDALGSDVTSASGVYRIDYPASAFRQGTIVDVELVEGPDLYFRITDGASVLLDEPRSAGKGQGRKNVAPCAVVDLCVDVPVPPTGVQPTIWTGIGTAFTLPDASSLNDFDADGYAGSAKYAITGTPRMTGSAALTVNGTSHPIEYRFLVHTTTTPNGGAPPAGFTRVVGVSPDDNLFVETRIGQMIRFSPFKIIDINAKLVDLDAEGWLDVNTCIHRTFVDRPDVDPVDIPQFQYVDLDALMAINTDPLTSAPDVPAAAAQPGQPVPAADRIGIEKIAIRFEAREVIDKATSTFAPMPGTGTTLNALVVNNNPAFLRLAMTEHLLGTPCQILTGDVHAAYTVHHPHLQAISLGVTSNDGSYDVSLSDPDPGDALPLSGNTNPAVVHSSDPDLGLPGTLHRCTYIVTLGVTRRLHSGDGAVGTNTAQTSFYWDGP